MKPKLRVLFIGFQTLPKEESDEFLKNWPYVETGRFVYNTKIKTYEWDEGISLYDYNILFLDYLGSIPGLSAIPTSLTMEFHSYLRDGGILCLFASREICSLIQNYIKIEPKPIGEAFKPKDQNHWIWKIINKQDYKFKWSSILYPEDSITNMEYWRTLIRMVQEQTGKSQQELSPPSYEEIAFTPNLKCISAIANYGKGKIIVLPKPCNLTIKLLREILDGIKDNYLQTKDTGTTPPPSWITSIKLPAEDDRRKEITTKYEKLQQDWQDFEAFTSPKKVLYLSGTELSKEVDNVLKRIGFNTTFKEFEKRQDIEIEHGELFGIVEVKGPTKHADVDDVRQLLDWWLEKSKENPNVKGILIVNHFCNTEPTSRGEPYTPHAVDLGTKNEFCLMTTIDLFNLYCKVLSKQITLNEIVATFWQTKGQVKI